MRLIHKHQHGTGNSPLQCNTPVGEGAGGDEFDGEDDEADQDRANGTPPDEPSGTEADETETGRQQAAEAHEV